MAQTEFTGVEMDAPLLDFLLRERALSLSARELQFRLAGYGYAIKDVEGKQVVTTIPQGVELGVLPDA